MTTLVGRQPANRTPVGEPTHGGTLRLRTIERIEPLDPALAHGAATRQLLWATSRQLFAYPPTTYPAGLGRPPLPVPDLAAELPSRANGTVSADRLRWTVRLRTDVRWDTTPPRPVTAHDVLRGLKRLAGPTARAAALAPLTEAIAGLGDYHAACRRFFAHTRPTAAACAAFAARHDIVGIRVPDDHTLVIRLRRPVDDLLHLLADTGLAPVPVEYDAHLPGEPGAALHATGPYRPADHRRGAVRLVPNPAWDRQTDPLRARFVDRIEARGDTDDLQAADLGWSRHGVPDLTGAGYALDPYLVFNLRGPDRPFGPRRHAVRRAVALAVDRLAVAEALAVPGVPYRLQHGLIPPGVTGHRPYDPWPTPYHRGDPGAARAALAGLGVPAWPPLTLAVPDDPRRREAAEIITAGLARAGIPATVTAHSDSALHDLLLDPAYGRAERWDMAMCAWTPTRCADPGRELWSMVADDAAGGRNHGGYRDARVDELVAAALRERDVRRAADRWHQVDLAVMRDLPVVPLVATAVTPLTRRAPRVRNVRFLPHLDRVDLTGVWLADG